MNQTDEFNPLPWDAQPAPEEIVITLPATEKPTGLRAAAMTLAVMRHEVAEREETLKRKRAAFEDTLSDERRKLEAAKFARDAADSEVRALAQLEYERTGSKKPCPGIEVTETTKYRVTDTAAALAWAKVSTVGYIAESFDEKAVIAAVSKGGATLPFVASEATYGTRIASDLLKALGE